MKNLIKKYTILIFIYAILYYLIRPYGFRIYFSFISEPKMIKETFLTIQSIISATIYVMNFIFMIFVLFDSKNRKSIDWIIIAITLIKADIGMIMFLIWQIYKEKENVAQHIV